LISIKTPLKASQALHSELYSSVFFIAIASSNSWMNNELTR